MKLKERLNFHKLQHLVYFKISERRVFWLLMKFVAFSFQVSNKVLDLSCKSQFTRKTNKTYFCHLLWLGMGSRDEAKISNRNESWKVPEKFLKSSWNESWKVPSSVFHRIADLHGIQHSLRGWGFQAGRSCKNKTKQNISSVVDNKSG